jgi:hypothetical protein
MPGLSTTTPIAEHQSERRRTPRITFKATSVVTETGSSQMVVAQTSELSRFGCFVQTMKPYPKGTRVHIELADGGDVFTASAAVAYVTGDGMGVVFSMVEPENYEVLAKWLSRTPRRSDRYSFGATAEVKDLGSRNEQVLITRDLSAGGCNRSRRVCFWGDACSCGMGHSNPFLPDSQKTVAKGTAEMGGSDADNVLTSDGCVCARLKHRVGKRGSVLAEPKSKRPFYTCRAEIYRRQRNSC